MQLIRSLLKPLHEHVEDARLEEEVVRLPVCLYCCALVASISCFKVKIAIYASLYSNLALCVLQSKYAIRDRFDTSMR